MIEVKKEFSLRDRLLFGPLFALFCGIICAILVHRFELTNVAIVICALAAVIIVVYYAVPAWQTSIYRGWLLSVAPIGWLVSHLLLALLYYGLLTPIGVVMRLVGYDPMQRALQPEAVTYWKEREAGQADAGRYFRQY